MSTSKYHKQDSRCGLLRSTSILSAGTFVSRVLGFIRDIILAKLLGTTFQADAFFVAFRIPNLFRELVGEGATNSSIVPVFSEYREGKKKEEFWHFFSVVFVLAFLILSLITLAGQILAPLLVRLIAPGFMQIPEKVQLTIHLTRIMFPYLLFIGLTAYLMGILYTFRSFKAPAFGPCLLNISLIASSFISLRYHFEPVVCLAIGVLIGGVAQLVLQILALRGQQVCFLKPKTLSHTGARKIGRLLIPRLFGAGVYQINILIDTLCASLAFIVGAGGISAIYFANRIIQFPIGLITLSLASAILPTLAGFAAREETDKLKDTLTFSLQNIFLVMVPCTVLLIILSESIIRVFFERGAFTSQSTAITSSALMFYSFGLLGFSMLKILVTAFHSLQDTKTPVKVAAVCLGISTLLKVILMFPLKIGGIALASALASTLNCLILFLILEKRIGSLGRALWICFLKILASSLLMGLCLRLFLFIFERRMNAFGLMASFLVAATAFLCFGFLFNLEPLQHFRRWFQKKF